jgi:hypothetical protein
MPAPTLLDLLTFCVLPVRTIPSCVQAQLLPLLRVLQCTSSSYPLTLPPSCPFLPSCSIPVLSHIQARGASSIPSACSGSPSLSPLHRVRHPHTLLHAGQGLTPSAPRHATPPPTHPSALRAGQGYRRVSTTTSPPHPFGLAQAPPSLPPPLGLHPPALSCRKPRLSTRPPPPPLPPSTMHHATSCPPLHAP